MHYLNRFLFVPCAIVLTIAGSLAAQEAQKTPVVNDSLLSGLKLRSIGPALMAGRIADIAVHPMRQSTWYVAVGSGGVWKTENAGTTWKSIFDGQGSYSTGVLAIDPNNPEVVWVGTGENVSGRHVGFGDGVYKSMDGGLTWTNMGLKSSEHVGRILIDPRNSNVVYVAAEGPLWSSGGDRGVFKSSDGGTTWTNILAISEHTGVTDLELDPRNPDILIAATYQRQRHVWGFLAGGPESGIHKTTDGGATWRQVKSGLPTGDIGKIGLAISPVNPDIVYATIEAEKADKGFYRSTNSGESWEKRNSYISGGTGPHYYQEIFASPHKADQVYQMDFLMHYTSDGGKTLVPIGEYFKHVDNHAMAFDNADPDYLLVGTDGGLYETWDHGKNWKFIHNLPVTQFYKAAVDNDYPFYNVVGGTQDNNTQLGPSRTINQNGIRNSDWIVTIGGDGHATAIDPEDPNIIYSEWQGGNPARFDKKTGELVWIRPQPAPGEPAERFNWDAPILISPHSHTRLYYGSQRLWRSDDRGDSWTAISRDLSRGENRYEKEYMERVWSVDALQDHYAMSNFANTTAISESPIQEGLIYAGTDDGLIQTTEDGGQTWRRSDSFAGVPEYSFVNEVKASVHDANIVFAVLDNHKMGDYAPYVIKSTDRGASWSSISGDLPARHLVWSIEQDHESPDLLFAGTEFGIFTSLNGGMNWIKLKGDAPTIPVRDLVIQRRESDLVAATFGRGFYIVDDYSPLRHMSSDVLSQEVATFPVKDAILYVQSIPLGLKEKSMLGDGHYFAENPPFGAVVTYHLRDTLKTSKDARREGEKAVRATGGDVAFPGYAALEQEDREDQPRIVMTVLDDGGNVVRSLDVPTTAGLHRVAWDLRYPAPNPTAINTAPPQSPWESRPIGHLVAPGTYSIQLSKMVDGLATDVGTAQTFNVIPLENATLPVQDRGATLAFNRQIAELQRQAQGAAAKVAEITSQIPLMRQAILDTPGATAELSTQLRSIEIQSKDIVKSLSGDPIPASVFEPTVPSVIDRLSAAAIQWDQTYGPTQTDRDGVSAAAAEFAEVEFALRVLRTDLESLHLAMDAAGAPWTSGR
jgi:photosystem II stability/assembly factor-like uncharacterized protein